MAKELEGMGLDSGLLEVPDFPGISNAMELDRTGMNTPDTSSIKYGLTYSVSEMTGISKFSVPSCLDNFGNCDLFLVGLDPIFDERLNTIGSKEL